MGAKLSGPAGQGGKTIEQNADINVTPFVDIMLVPVSYTHLTLPTKA